MFGKGSINECLVHIPTVFDDQSMQGEPNTMIRLEVLCKFPASILGGTTICKVSRLNFSKCTKTMGRSVWGSKTVISVLHIIQPSLMTNQG